jgi:tripartite-type tricarboxylate transporter receptor subunit TctC
MKQLIALMLALLAAVPGVAQTYPDRPLRVIVPYQAGGTVDILARKTAQALQPYLKQPIVVDNHPGANGVIGIEAAAHAAPDGYTLLFNSSAMIANQAVYPKLRYDTLRDFIPVSETMTQEGYLLLVNSTSAFKGLKDLLAAAHSRPGVLTYATPGVGNSQHLLVETLSHKTGVRMTHVPYKGIPDMLSALMRSDVDCLFLNFLLAEPHIKSGKLRAIAFVGRDSGRLPAMPEVPSVAETLPGFTWTGSRFGFFVPAKTPAAVVARLQSDIIHALQTPDLRSYLTGGGFAVVGGTSEEFVKVIESDLKRYIEIVRVANIQAE